mmetsp:Transcript_9230/g.23396  ORF Transcript_9230/g.23396 Transcript_9230/m.23396 type:complete len:269 (-) Transcript_9230:760-1566(-)
MPPPASPPAATPSPAPTSPPARPSPAAPPRRVRTQPATSLRKRRPCLWAASRPRSSGYSTPPPPVQSWPPPAPSPPPRAPVLPPRCRPLHRGPGRYRGDAQGTRGRVQPGSGASGFPSLPGGVPTAPPTRGPPPTDPPRPEKVPFPPDNHSPSLPDNHSLPNTQRLRSTLPLRSPLPDRAPLPSPVPPPSEQPPPSPQGPRSPPNALRSKERRSTQVFAPLPERACPRRRPCAPPWPPSWKRASTRGLDRRGSKKHFPWRNARRPLSS